MYEYTTTGFQPGDKVTIRELLYGILLKSGSDAVNAAVRITTTTEKEFINLMNQKAKELNLTHTYFSNPIGKDKDDNVVTLQEVLENDERNIEDEVDLKMKIKKLYSKISEILKDREKTIIELRFGLDGHKPKTQHEIAEMLGISRSYVSRIETKAISKLHKELKE